jgi:hypothetical protein
MAQDALRGVVKMALKRAAAPEGLPGDHHFYITFKTQGQGVDIPKHLAERFPDEMTIVIQNRFWDLRVLHDRFEVGLSFNQVPARLVIPFAAVTAFVDPAVNFALQFQAQIEESTAAPEATAENDAPADAPAPDGSNVVSVDFTRKK